MTEALPRADTSGRQAPSRSEFLETVHWPCHLSRVAD